MFAIYYPSGRDRIVIDVLRLLSLLCCAMLVIAVGGLIAIIILLGNLYTITNDLQTQADMNTKNIYDILANFTGGNRFVIQIPIIGITFSGGTYYTSLGAPTDIIGNSSSGVTILPNIPAGDSAFFNGTAFRVLVEFCVEYSSQGGPPTTRRTFYTLTFDDFIVDSCAISIPRPSILFRHTAYAEYWGLNPGQKINALMISSALGTPTIVGGGIYIING